MPESSKKKSTAKKATTKKTVTPKTSNKTTSKKTTSNVKKETATPKVTVTKSNDDVKNSIKMGSEAIKSEAKSTVNDVKETIRNVDIKTDAKVTTNFVSSMLKNPLDTLRKIANDSKSTALKHAIILLIVWTVAVLINSIFGTNWVFKYVASNILSVIKAILAPALGVITLSVITYVLQGSNKKSLTSIFTTVTIASTPIILVTVLSLLKLFSGNFVSIVEPLNQFGVILTAVFMYFSLKAVIGTEENSRFIKSFMLIQILYFLVYFVLTFLGIYIPMI